MNKYSSEKKYEDDFFSYILLSNLQLVLIIILIFRLSLSKVKVKIYLVFHFIAFLFNFFSSPLLYQVNIRTNIRCHS
jgi:hypothetical protein